MNETANQLLRYHVWANRQLVKHLKTLPQDLLAKEMDSVFPTIAQTLGHIISADKVWLSRIQQKSPTRIKDVSFTSVEAAEDALNQHEQHLSTFMQTAGEDAEQRNLTTIHVGRMASTKSVC